MTDLRRAVFLLLAAAACAARPALSEAQTASAAPGPPASSVLIGQAPAAPAAPAAPDVQQVRDELARLKQEFDVLRQQYDQRLQALEQRLSQIGGPSMVEVPASATPVAAAAPPPTSRATPTADAPAPDAPAPPAQPAQAGGNAQNMAGASKAFNPDIAVIANFVGVAGKNPLQTDPPLQLREAEMSFQAVVDPYARADFFLSAGPEGLDVEEGYMTLTTLPGGLLAKVGKMRAQFGKVNTMHSHVLPWADRPLVTQNLVGGEDGISESGLSLSKLIPNGFMFLEATGELFAGDSDVFHSTARSKLAYVGRLRAYRDLSEGVNVDLGTSAAFGQANLANAPATFLPPVTASLDRRLIGVDATLRYRPLRRAIYKRFVGRTELVWSRQNQAVAPPIDAFGFYVSGEYQFARRWFVGARFDQSQRAFDATLTDRGGSFLLTYWPSEFSQIRGQYRRTSYGEGITANEFLFQFNFAIGAHGAHVF